MYEDYYAQQSGKGGAAVFRGYRMQRGHGLGSILSGLFRSAVPMIKKGLAFFGRQALKTGAQIANDVAEGEPLGESAKKRVGETIKRFVNPQNESNQTGSGALKTLIRKLHKKKRQKSNKKRKTVKKRKYDDIFA